jgi:hypothetical protein
MCSLALLMILVVSGRGHHFHEDFDLDGGGTNLFHRNYDLSANDYGLDDETTLH